MRASPTFAAALVLALLAGCSSSPGENSYATPAVANVRLTKAQRSHIQLYTVVPLGYQQTAEQYRGTVLTAFQNVADTLVALEQDAETLKADAAATTAAKASLDLARLQYKDGYAAYLSVLNADQAYQQARLAEVQAEADRFTDTAALFQALGGGWWHQPELESADAR